MITSNIPRKFPIPFGNNAGGAYIRTIPQAHQPATSTDAPASLYDGFPPETFIKSGVGGVPPMGADLNGILNQLTAWARWQAAGGPVFFDATFISDGAGGYPKWAILASATEAGAFWISTVDGNTTDPDGVSAAGWTKFAAPTYTTDASGNWKRVASDGFIEMGGVFSPVRQTEGTFVFTLPFGGFPTQALGFLPVVRNVTAGLEGVAILQEVALTNVNVTLMVQSDRTTSDISGMRWRAWGR